MLGQVFAREELTFHELQSKVPSYYKKDFKKYNVLRLDWVLRFSVYLASILILFSKIALGLLTFRWPLSYTVLRKISKYPWRLLNGASNFQSTDSQEKASFLLINFWLVRGHPKYKSVY